MGERLFITGATGNTGRTLLELLFRDEALKDIGITCLCRPGGRRYEPANRPVKLVEGDTSNAESLKRAYNGEGTVIHISSILHAQTVLEGCRPIKRLIAISSTGVFSRYRTLAEKIASGEDLIEKSGVPYTILRPTMIYGTPADRNISRLIRLIKHSPAVLLPAMGRSIFQPVHVEDLCSCILAALKEPETSTGKTYNIPGGSAHSLREMFDIVSGLLGRRVTVIPIPLSLADLAVRTLGLISKRPILSREQILRLKENKSFSYERAARDLTYKPMSFSEGVARQISAMGL